MNRSPGYGGPANTVSPLGGTFEYIDKEYRDGNERKNFSYIEY